MYIYIYICTNIHVVCTETLVYRITSYLSHVFIPSKWGSICATRCEVQKPAEALFEFHRGTGAAKNGPGHKNLQMQQAAILGTQSWRNRNLNPILYSSKPYQLYESHQHTTTTLRVKYPFLLIRQCKNSLKFSQVSSGSPLTATRCATRSGVRT